MCFSVGVCVRVFVSDSKSVECVCVSERVFVWVLVNVTKCASTCVRGCVMMIGRVWMCVCACNGVSESPFISVPLSHISEQVHFFVFPSLKSVASKEQKLDGSLF